MGQCDMACGPQDLYKLYECYVQIFSYNHGMAEGILRTADSFFNAIALFLEYHRFWKTTCATLAQMTETFSTGQLFTLEQCTRNVVVLPTVFISLWKAMCTPTNKEH